MNHNNFHFTQIPDMIFDVKINDVIFLKSPKTMFWAILGHFCPMWIFSKKSGSVTPNYYIWAPNITLSFRKKLMSQSRENLQTDGRVDGETLSYETFPTEDGGPRTSLQQVTGENTPNLILKRMLKYF